MFTTRYYLLLLLLFTATVSIAQPLPLDTAVRTGVLPNGFTYYIRKNTEPAQRVQLWLVNKVGSVLENNNQRGLAHFMEHMSFNGTKHYPKNTLVEYLQKSGVRFGADLNAYTSFDETVYQLPLPSDDPDLLHNGLQIMRDWAKGATLDPKEINDERGVVLEEKRLGKGAGERMQQKYLPVLLNHSRYADRVPIGTENILTTFQRNALLDFYNDWYRPNLQALIVVGDINVDAIEADIKKMFGDLVNPVAPKPRIKYTVPLSGKNQFIAVTDKENPDLVLQVLIKQKAHSLITAADYYETIQRGIFNQLLAARMEALAQQSNPPFLEAVASMDDLLGGLDAFTVTVVAKPGLLEKSTKVVWAEVERVKKYGFNQSELDRAKVNYLNSLQSALKEKDKRNSQELVEEYTRLFLKQEASPGIEREAAMTEQYLPGLSLTQVNGLISHYIKSVDRDIIIMAPQSAMASLPKEPTVNGWLLAAAKNLQPFKDDFAATALIDGKLVPGKVTKENNLAALGITEWYLSNGARVLLKPTNFKNEEIRFQAFSTGGSSLYPDSLYQSAAAAAGIVDASGISHFSPTDLPKLLAGKTIELQPYISERAQGMSGSTTPKDLEATLQLMHLYFTSPRKDTAVFNNLIAQSETMITNRYTEPDNVFTDTVNAILSSHAYRRSAPTIDKLHQINLDTVMSIYKQRFANAGAFTFLFVGNFNIDSIRSPIEEYIGSLPGTATTEAARDLGIRPPTGTLTTIVRKGSEDKATVRIVIGGDYDYAPANNIQLLALGEILQFKVTDRLREKEGGAYSPGVRTSYTKLPTGRYSFTIVFGCAPANVDKLVAAAKDEIAQLQANGATDADITKFTTEQTRQYELQLKSNGFWLGNLGARLENGDDLNGILGFKDRLKLVTTSSVKQAANQYLNNGNFLQFVLLPEKTK
ncbi:MAG: insulinase family protein [Chitinophagaceae bacterium]